MPSSNIGAAIAMDEYVPMMMPKPIARVKPLSPEPPKMYIISTTINVVKDVKMVLEIVWLMLLVITCGLRERALPRFSRIRSKTTIVSFSEYPMSVRKAAIIARLILKSPIKSVSPIGDAAI